MCVQLSAGAQCPFHVPSASWLYSGASTSDQWPMFSGNAGNGKSSHRVVPLTSPATRLAWWAATSGNGSRAIATFWEKGTSAPTVRAAGSSSASSWLGSAMA